MACVYGEFRTLFFIFRAFHLANMGLPPSLAGNNDLWRMNASSHDSLGKAKIASANGADLQEFGAASIENPRAADERHYNERNVASMRL